MPKPLTPEQLAALRAMPLLDMPNKVRLVLTLTNTQQTDVLEETGLTAVEVSRAATGKGVTSVETARALARFFELDVEDLFPEPDPVDDGSDRRSGQERRTVEA